MKMKKVLAVVMAFCMTAGAVSYGTPVITQSITAQAAGLKGSCFFLNDKTGVLTIWGEVNGDAISFFKRRNVSSVIAEEGTVLPEDCSKLFAGFSACMSFDLSKADTSNVTDMSGMFENCSSLTTLDLSSFDTRKVTDMSSMFCNCNKLSSVDISGFETSSVSDMSSMFEYCKKLKAVDVSCFDTSNVTNMSSMFGSCYALTKLDISGFVTYKVTQFDNMFCDCLNLTKVDVSGFDTGNAANMGYMFCGCTDLKELDVSGFDTRNVMDMNSMFYNCSALTALDVSRFDTGKVCNMFEMLDGCQNLTALDLSGFDTSNVTNMSNMFSNCDKLKTLTLGENFKSIEEEAALPNGEGWTNAKAPTTVISGNDEFAVIENSGKNTYMRLPIEEETKPTYPTNIKVEYSEKYRQVRFTWDKVEGADRYGIAVYLAGKWRVQKQDVTGTIYTSPKNLTPGKTYKVAIAARVNGKWDTANAIKNAVTVTIRGNNTYVKPDKETLYGAELYVIANKITMYLGPDTSYGKVTTIPAQTMLTELGVMNDNNNWVFTEYKGQYGWVQIVNDDGKQQISVFFPSVDKPVIYLYPEKETEVHVEVELTEADLATTYPKYNNGWDVVAKPDGSLVNKADGTHHRYLFWDAVNCL
uniref:BspA family leucine-rich repeat surface protein n=1 Tax=Ruminococcus sp. TaxID=41978 RepID=UPI0025ED38B4